MNSFHLTAIGRLADNPTTGTNGDVRFALIGDDYAGKGREPVTTTVYFVPFNAIGEAIAAHAKKGVSSLSRCPFSLSGRPLQELLLVRKRRALCGGSGVLHFLGQHRTATLPARTSAAAIRRCGHD
jgi:hypothetical protein